MAKNSNEAYGAESRSNLLMFDPERLMLIEQEGHPLYDPRVRDPVDAFTVASIREVGVKIPVTVWRDPETGITCVVDGRGRVKACREANKLLVAAGLPARMVPAIVGKGDAKTAMGTMVLANEGRKEPTAIGRAHMAKRLLESGYSEPEVGMLLHVSRSGLRNYMSLLEMPLVVQKAVADGRVAATLGYELAKLPPEQQKEKLGVMLAAAGSEVKGGRTRAKKMREASGETTVRRRPEIQRKLDEVRADGKHKVTERALEWVLGMRESLL